MPGKRRPDRLKDSLRSVDSRIRVIGGTLRGRTIHYNGDPGLRPMKDRVREAVFNLVGPRVAGMYAIDLFAGTGAMAIESISRGARAAFLLERRFPNVDQIKLTAKELDIADRITVQAGDTFAWGTRTDFAKESPWLVFCCPPYDFFIERQVDLAKLIEHLWNHAPAGSVFVVESDERFNPAELLEADWDVRTYAPAVVGIVQKEG